VGEALLRDGVAVLAGVDLHQVTLNRPVRDRVCAQIGQHPRRVGLAGGLHDPGDHQVPEHRIINRVETEPVIDRAEDVVKQPRMGRRGPPGRRRGTLRPSRRGNQFTGAPVGDPIDRLGPGGDLDIENTLILGGHPTGPLEQDPQLRIGMG
jgi:hypothetical protein